MLGILWNIGAFIIALSLLISVHELGHFLVARFYGVHIKRFSIGFGKPLWRYIDRHRTEFIIALIPLGGYVKMLDDPIESVTLKERPCTFNNKSVGQRTAIISAGSIANFIFTVFIYWVIFIIGIPGVRPVVGEITANSIAENAKITPGMEFKAIDGIETPDWNAVRLQLIGKIGDAQTTVRIAPFGSNQQQEKVLDLRQWSFDPDKGDPVIALGIFPHSAKIETILDKVLDHCAAQKAGLRAGDKIIKVNGQMLTQWIAFVNLVHNNLGKPLELEVEREGRLLLLTLIPDINPNGNKNEGFVGVVPKVVPLSDEYQIIHRYGLINAFINATKKTWQLIKLTISILEKLIIGNIKLNSFSGPISIAKGAGISAKFGVIYYLMFLAFISVNLGVINLIPLPILDGGHLLFLLIEKLRGNPISERIQNISYRIGLIFLILLMGFALFNDCSRL